MVSRNVRAFIAISAILLAISVITVTMSIIRSENSTLRHISVVFRHGDRTPDGVWPTYENQKEDFYPYGIGELTNKGKKTAFKIGTELRQHYDDFLGDLLLKNTVMAMSSPYNRAKNTLNYACAGLYPPTEKQVWNDNFLWQSIPYSYQPIITDKIFFAVLSKKGKELVAEFKKTAEYEKMIEPLEEINQYIETKSGWDKTNLINVLRIHYELEFMEQLNYELPDWTKLVYPKNTKDLPLLIYNVITYSDDILRYSGGYLLQNILTQIQSVIDGTNVDRKIDLYSGHEINIAGILGMFNLYDNKPPACGSYVALELHEINSEYFIRLVHQNYEFNNPVVLSIPGCSKMCQLEVVYEMVKNRMPIEGEDIGPIAIDYF